MARYFRFMKINGKLSAITKICSTSRCRYLYLIYIVNHVVCEIVISIFKSCHPFPIHRKLNPHGHMFCWMCTLHLLTYILFLLNTITYSKYANWVVTRATTNNDHAETGCVRIIEDLSILETSLILLNTKYHFCRIFSITAPQNISWLHTPHFWVTQQLDATRREPKWVAVIELLLWNLTGIENAIAGKMETSTACLSLIIQSVRFHCNHFRRQTASYF